MNYLSRLNNHLIIVLPDWEVVRERFDDRGDDIQNINSLRSLYDLYRNFSIQPALRDMPNVHILTDEDIDVSSLVQKLKSKEKLTAAVESLEKILSWDDMNMLSFPEAPVLLTEWESTWRGDKMTHSPTLQSFDSRPELHSYIESLKRESIMSDNIVYPKNLSKHFTFMEMTRTDHRKYLDDNRKPSEDVLQSGISLCETILEPIRVHFNKPVVIHSGYRGPELNKAIGGSKFSQHMKFEAADFHVSGVDLEEVFNWIWKESDIKWGQLILEGWSVGSPSWIHISLGSPWRDEKKCQQVLTFEAGKYTRLQ
jgi:hypothetical protein